MFPTSLFPKLALAGYTLTSPPSWQYNCIAWAADNATDWWEPCKDGYWPPGAPIEHTLHAYVEAFRTLRYEVCDDGSLEPGFDKIALYANSAGPTHASRQLDDGSWTSKMGAHVDIVHPDAGTVEGPKYGSLAVFMRRPKA